MSIFGVTSDADVEDDRDRVETDVVVNCDIEAAWALVSEPGWWVHTRVHAPLLRLTLMPLNRISPLWRNRATFSSKRSSETSVMSGCCVHILLVICAFLHRKNEHLFGRGQFG